MWPLLCSVLLPIGESRITFRRKRLFAAGKFGLHLKVLVLFVTYAILS